MPPKIIISETLDPICVDWLSQRAQVVTCSHKDQAALRRELAAAQGLIVRTYTIVDDHLLDQAPLLKVVGRAGVGLDNIDLKACKARGVPVVYTPDANTQAVAEFTIAVMLDALRPRYTLPGPVPEAEFHRLRKDIVGRQLDELTLGILGFGRIGKRVGRMAAGIGMKLLVNDLLPEAQLRAQVNFPFEFVPPSRLLAESDVLSIHVDGRDANHHLINAAALGQLKPSCVLINAARGMLVDAAALAEWARAHQAQGGQLVLDVHDPEPPAESYPLFGLPNVRLLPHLAARTDRAMENMSWVVRDVLEVVEGRPPQNPAW